MKTAFSVTVGACSRNLLQSKDMFLEIARATARRVVASISHLAIKDFILDINAIFKASSSGPFRAALRKLPLKVTLSSLSPHSSKQDII